jgi:anthranilate synthase component 1
MDISKEYNRVKKAQPGQIVPIVRRLDMGTAVDFFAKLSDYGRRDHSCLFESKEYLAASGALSFATARPALYLSGAGAEFTVKALGPAGRRILRFLAARAERFDFCRSVKFDPDEISGAVRYDAGPVDEQARLKSVNQMDVLRAVAFAFKLASRPFRVTCGLLGAVSYDFIDQFEKLPASRADQLGNPDYELYFADNIALFDHEKQQGFAVVNCIVTDEGPRAAFDEAVERLEYYEKAAAGPVPAARAAAAGRRVETDTPRDEYERMVRTAKKHIVDGDILQVVLSRTKIVSCRDEPLDVYKRLRTLNPSPYMFYIKTPRTSLMGSSPELSLRVSGPASRRVVEIRPIAGTKPRGRVDGVVDADTDFRYEAELKLDYKELAEHIMLVDLARNDIARVAAPGSRIVTELLTVEKYSSVQHLVSNVKGTLSPALDALSAYVATMNMGTLTGAPKIEAMKIIRRLETYKRGYYGGAVMYLTVDGNFDSCITIRSLQVKDGQAYIRAGAGIVHDSIPSSEFDETEHKAESCLRAVEGRAD